MHPADLSYVVTQTWPKSQLGNKLVNDANLRVQVETALQRAKSLVAKSDLDLDKHDVKSVVQTLCGVLEGVQQYGRLSQVNLPSMGVIREEPHFESMVLCDASEKGGGGGSVNGSVKDLVSGEEDVEFSDDPFWLRAIPHFVIFGFAAAWLAVGAWVFMLVDKEIGIQDYNDVLLFTFQVCTTIGWGDIKPTNVWSQTLVIFYTILGVPIIFSALSNVGRILSEFYCHDWLWLTAVVRRKNYKKAKIRRRLPIKVAACLLVVHQFLGVILFNGPINEMGIVGSIYFSLTSVATIGFGDYTPQAKNLFETIVVIVYISAGIIILSALLVSIAYHYQRVHYVSLKAQLHYLSHIFARHMPLDFVFAYFLERHIQLKEDWLRAALEYVSRSNKSDSELARFVFHQWLHADLQATTDACLHDLDMKPGTLEGSYVLQVQSVLDISESFHKQFNELTYTCPDNAEFQGGPYDEDDHKENQWHRAKAKRMLMLELSDGERTLKALEYSPVRKLSIMTCPGCKVLIRGPVKFRNQTLLLTKETVQVLGGEVEQLMITNGPVELMAARLNRPIPRPNRTSLDGSTQQGVAVTHQTARSMPSSAARTSSSTLVPSSRSSLDSGVRMTPSSASEESQRRPSETTTTPLNPSNNVSRTQTSAPSVQSTQTSVSSCGSKVARPDYLNMTSMQMTDLIVEDDDDNDWPSARSSSPENSQFSAVQRQLVNKTYTAGQSHSVQMDNVATKRRSEGSAFPSRPIQPSVTSTLRPLSVGQPPQGSRRSDDVVPESPQKPSNVPSTSLTRKPTFTMPTTVSRISGGAQERPLLASTEALQQQNQPVLRTVAQNVVVVKQPPPDEEDEIQVVAVKSELPSIPPSRISTSPPRSTVPHSPLTSSPVTKRSRTSEDRSASRLSINSFNISSECGENASNRDRTSNSLKNLNLVQLDEVDRQWRMPMYIGRKTFGVTATIAETLEPFRVEDGEWTMKVRLVDESDKSLDCVVHHAVLCDLVGMTPEEAIAIKQSSNMEKRRDGANRIRMLQEQMRRTDLVFDVEFCYRARPVIKRMETVAQRLTSPSTAASQLHR
ncbi:recQ-mediated genome instability protein 1-like protein [Aphelenchoides avenae]|nr:recQ-mediated genome instability protein 1-like protein [Aphelenchus avenae]